MLPKDEYLNIIRQEPNKMSISITNHEKLAENNQAYRMDYSRCIFAKKWGVKDYWEMPQVTIHNEILKINDIPKSKIKYLNKNMEESEVDA